MSPFIVVVVVLLTVLFALLSAVHLLAGGSEAEGLAQPRETKTV